jgi:crossover junction endodeoxyribonuclease RuvC
MSVKAAITGNGRADKTDIHIMVKRLIALPERKQLDDEIDAIAIGLTYFAEHKIQPK